MTQNRSHLTPTPIVDKNGVITSRLKKTDVPATSRQSSIPPVSMITPAMKQDTLVDEVMMAFRAKGAPQHDRKYFSMLHEDDPETLPLTMRLMHTGSSIAQDRAFNSAFRMVADIYAAESSYGNGWRGKCAYSWSPFNKNKLAIAWHVGNVVAETGYTGSPADLESRVFMIDDQLHLYSSHGDRSHRDEYWRGLGIITASGLYLKREDYDNAMKFAEWAGKHPQPEQVIRLIAERETLDIDTISGILEQQGDKATALQDGLL